MKTNKLIDGLDMNTQKIIEKVESGYFGTKHRAELLSFLYSLTTNELLKDSELVVNKVKKEQLTDINTLREMIKSLILMDCQTHVEGVLNKLGKRPKYHREVEPYLDPVSAERSVVEIMSAFVKHLSALEARVREEEQKHALYIAENYIINRQLGSPTCKVVTKHSYKTLLKNKSLSQ